jgi:drug/metabolite transporter (DMT)-like permease
MQGGGGGQANQPGELDIGAVGVGLELLEEPHVNQIKRNWHFTKYFIVLRPRCQIQLDFGGNSPILIHMQSQNRSALFALAAAGTLWGLNVPLTKLALGWLGPAWLTVARFLVAAPVLGLVGRRGLREALTLPIVASGAIGFGVVIVLQNAGIERTSVSHAAMIVGAIPVLVALIAAGLGQTSARPLTWAGYAVALTGIAFVAGAAGGGASPRGDLLVLGSAVLSAGFIAIQPRLLAERDAAAVTAVQFAGGALIALPVALWTGGMPHGPTAVAPAVALGLLALAGTPLPFWLFAFGQARVPADLAGAFLNLEPVVGVAAGWLALGEPAGVGQLAGVAAVLAGIAMSTMPAKKPRAASLPVTVRLRQLAYVVLSFRA